MPIPIPEAFIIHLFPAHLEDALHKFIFLNLNELTITETELKLIAVAAIIGDSNRPNTGYSTPAAIGTPSEL